MVDAEIGDGTNDAVDRSDRCRWSYGRAKLESEDSSYDSDYENSDPLTSPQCYGEASHEEVGRTVSDTLGAEFAEYVGPPAVVPEVTVEKEDGGEDRAILVDPDYTNRVEFSLKLGYTEKQAQIALQKLGSKAEQNELLAELIRLGANESGRSTETKYMTLDCVALTTPSKSVDATVGGREGFGLRHIVIDGSNVAMSHGNKEVFSCRGIKLCVDWFKARGHKEITVFVPLWRKETSRPDAITKDQEILWELEKERLLVFTPSRQISGRRMACHDDRYILKLAAETDGVVVSNDNYRDLVNENPEYKRVIEERLLMYSFVNDRFMPPDDPLGRHGPSLDTFLRTQPKLLEPLPPSCPYGKKCTYGNKCKYYHPERGNQPHKSVSEQLVEQAKINIQEVKTRNIKIHEHLTEGSKLKGTLSSPLPGSKSVDRLPAKMALHRTKSLLVPADSTSDAQGISEAKRLDGKVKQIPVDSGQGSFSLWKEDGGPFTASSTSSSPMSTWSSSLYDDCGNHLSVAKRLSDPDSRKGVQGEAGNMHRKLQRQLTLNPCYDPRLAHMKSFEPPITGSLISDSDAASPSHPKEHATLTRHCSASTADALSNVRANWGTPDNHHQAVARIASAPDSYRQWRPSASHPRRATSTSDMQLQHYDATSFFWGSVTLPPGGPSVPVPSPHSGQMRSWQKSSLAPPTHGPTGIMTPNMSFEDQRRFLYYHLASVFPEEQVRAAMEINPDETNPQAICARILTMFPRPK